MSKQHHYIVSYNTARNEWELDADAESVKYEHGTIYNYETDTWHRDYNEDGQFYPEAERLSKAISQAIKQLNNNQEHCDWCNATTDNGAGHYQDELGTEDRVCTECFTQNKGLKS
jgi:endo-beta-N-acetylglucosaminidase D